MLRERRKRTAGRDAHHPHAGVVKETNGRCDLATGGVTQAWKPSASSSVPYHATKRALQLSQFTWRL